MSGPQVAPGPSQLVWFELGIRRRLSPKWWGSCHEPSRCRRGMWLYVGRMFRLDAEPGVPQVVVGNRGSAGRVATAGGGGESRIGPELPHAVRAQCSGRG